MERTSCQPKNRSEAETQHARYNTEIAIKRSCGIVETRDTFARLIRRGKRRRVVQGFDKNCNFRRISAVIEWQKIRKFVSLDRFARG